MSNRRVLVIGLDGATWTILRPLAQDGRMPCLKRLREKGSSGAVLSTLPPVSPPAWTSITTGKNPGKHGIFDFGRVGSCFRHSLCTSISKMAKEIWDYVDGSVVANVPLTYPPKKISGLMVSGMGTPSVKSQFTYPNTLKNEILDRIPGYSIELDWQDYVGRREDLFHDVVKATEQRIRLFWYLFSLEWNFFFFVFTEPDRIQHVFWGSKRLGDYYTGIDRFLRDVVRETLGENIVLIVLSDHGFQSVEKIVHVNTILRELGLTKAKNPGLKKPLERIGMTKEHLWELVRKTGLFQAYRDMPPRILHMLRRAIPGRSNIEYDLDLNKTVAAMAGYGAIHLNKWSALSAHSPRTMSLVENIARSLEEQRDCETGARIFERIYRKDELYRGPFVDWAPELVVLPSENYALSARMEKETISQSDFLRGYHNPKGILLIQGKDVKEDFHIEGASVYDIAPTMLHILGLPVPEDMDGRVLTEVFEEGSQLDRPVSYRKQGEEERIRQRIKEMKALGRV